MNEQASDALDWLAWDALRDPGAPPVLLLAAWRYVYRGDPEPLRVLLLTAAAGLAPATEKDGGEE